MKHAKTQQLASRAGFVAGLAAVAVAVAAWQIPAGAGTLGLDVRVLANSTGELGLDPAGVVLNARQLDERRDTAGAATTVANQTGRELAVRLRALPESRDLDDVLHVEASAGGRALYSGPLGGLRAWSAPLRVEAGGSLELSLRLSLIAGVDGYRGRAEDIELELHSRPLEREGSG